MTLDRDGDLKRTRKKERLKTALLAAVFILGAIVALDYVIGDPNVDPTRAE